MISELDRDEWNAEDMKHQYDNRLLELANHFLKYVIICGPRCRA